MTVKILQPGDVTELGVVDTNHCGLPWPVGMVGEKTIEIYGAICLIPNRKSDLYESTICDAISGKPLDASEIERRINNIEFDYYIKYGIDRDSVLPKKYRKFGPKIKMK